MPFEPLQLIAGGVLGFTSAGALRWWQYRRDIWISLVERFCDALEEAADCSTEYWLQEKIDPAVWDHDSDKAGDAASDKKEQRALAVQEAKILGLQTRLDGLLASFESRLRADDAAKIRLNLEGMTDALTGGNFQGLARGVDAERAQLAQVYAGDLLVDVRRAVDRALSLKGLLIHMNDNARRRQSSAIKAQSPKVE